MRLLLIWNPGFNSWQTGKSPAEQQKMTKGLGNMNYKKRLEEVGLCSSSKEEIFKCMKDGYKEDESRVDLNFIA